MKLKIFAALLFFSSMAFAIDPFRNNAIGNVYGNVHSTDTTITLFYNYGPNFPQTADTDFATGFNVEIWDATTYPNISLAWQAGQVEIIRVKANLYNVMTVTRAQEGTTALNFIQTGHTVKMIQAITSKAFTDIQAAINLKATGSTLKQGAYLSDTLKAVNKPDSLTMPGYATRTMLAGDTTGINSTYKMRKDSVNQDGYATQYGLSYYARAPLCSADSNLSLGSGGNWYVGFNMANAAPTAAKNWYRMYLPKGVMKNLHCNAVSTGGNTSCTITIYKNAASTTLASTFTAQNSVWGTESTDLTHSVSFTYGDDVQILISPVTNNIVRYYVYVDFFYQ